MIRQLYTNETQLCYGHIKAANNRHSNVLNLAAVKTPNQ